MSPLSSSPGRSLYPGPSPDPDLEISTIRLLRWCGSWLRSPDPHADLRCGQGVALQERRVPLPRETRSVASTAKPLEPVALRRFDQWHQIAVVATDAEVVEVPLNASRKRGVLHCDRVVSMASTPVGRDLDRSLQARGSGLAPHAPYAPNDRYEPCPSRA